jgi:hypothetical protein
MISQAVVKMVLPVACAWAQEQEAVILRDGVALTASQIADARQIGVAHPERVRLRVVEQIPLPLHSMLTVSVGREHAFLFTFALLENSRLTKRRSSPLLEKLFGTLGTRQKINQTGERDCPIMLFGRFIR